MYNFSFTEILEWEENLSVKNTNRIYKTQKNFVCPRKKKLEDYRHHRCTKHFFRHEVKYIRKLSNRKFRRKLKQNIYDEVYYNPVNHDYKTYGWLTW